MRWTGSLWGRALKKGKNMLFKTLEQLAMGMFSPFGLFFAEDGAASGGTGNAGAGDKGDAGIGDKGDAGIGDKGDKGDAGTDDAHSQAVRDAKKAGVKPDSASKKDDAKPDSAAEIAALKKQLAENKSVMDSLDERTKILEPQDDKKDERTDVQKAVDEAVSTALSRRDLQTRQKEMGAEVMAAAKGLSTEMPDMLNENGTIAEKYLDLLDEYDPFKNPRKFAEAVWRAETGRTKPEVSTSRKRGVTLGSSRSQGGAKKLDPTGMTMNEIMAAPPGSFDHIK